MALLGVAQHAVGGAVSRPKPPVPVGTIAINFEGLGYPNPNPTAPDVRIFEGALRLACCCGCMVGLLVLGSRVGAVLCVLVPTEGGRLWRVKWQP